MQLIKRWIGIALAFLIMCIHMLCLSVVCVIVSFLAWDRTVLYVIRIRFLWWRRFWGDVSYRESKRRHEKVVDNI